MIFTVFKLILTGFLFSPAAFSESDPTQWVLDDSDVNQPRYVYVAENQENNKYSNKEKGVVAVSHGRSTYGAPEGKLKHPIEKLTLNLAGKDLDVQRGSVVLTHDSQVLEVQNVYPDGRIATLDKHAYYLPDRKKVVIIDSTDVKGRNIRCKLGVCEGKEYVSERPKYPYEIISVSHVALVCDNRQIEEFIELWKFASTTSQSKNPKSRPNCKVGKKIIIDRVFNNGTILSGSLLFNPFSNTAERFVTPEEIEYGVDI